MVKIADIELGQFPLLLAPMEDVSDPPFRLVCKANGADLMYTEFISSDGLIRDADKSVQKLDFYEEERPIGIQLFGSDIYSMAEAAEIAEEAGPNLIDINYGCPVKKVACKGAGAGMLQDLPKMQKMTEEIVKRVKLPVTVKTRLGWDDGSINVMEAAQRLQDVGVQALTIHARTRVQLYKGTADWSWIAKVKNNPSITIPIFGNGDVDSPLKALEYRNRFGVDGIMIGRGSIGNPWIFREVKHFMLTGNYLPGPTVEERVATCLQHFEKSLSWKGDVVGIVEMRRHYNNYFKGFPDFKSIRMRLVESMDTSEIRETLHSIPKIYAGYEGSSPAHAYQDETQAVSC